MIIPNDKACRDILEEMEEMEELTQWEKDFVDSNQDRMFFTGRQKEIFASFADKYDLESWPQ